MFARNLHGSLSLKGGLSTPVLFWQMRSEKAESDGRIADLKA